MTKRGGAWLLIGFAAVFAIVVLGAMTMAQSGETQSAVLPIAADAVPTTVAAGVAPQTTAAPAPSIDPPAEAVPPEQSVDANPTTPATERPTVEATPPVEAESEFSGSPVRVRIPEIGVDANVIDLGLNPDGSLEVPSDFAETGWYTGRSVSGEPGPSVVVGHVDSTSGPAVFYRLRDLEEGHTIEIERSDGSVASFRVSSSVLVDKDEFPTERVYGSTPEPTLRLITCGGAFDSSARSYEGNLIVYAEHLGNSYPKAASLAR